MDLVLPNGFEQSPRGKATFQQRTQLTVVVGQGQERGTRFKGEGKGHPFNHKGVVSIELDQAEETPDIVVFHTGFEHHIAAAILGHIPKVAVPLGIELRGQKEIVVVTLWITVLARIKVVDMFPQQNRPTAAEYVVKKSLSRVGIEQLGSGFCVNGSGEVSRELVGVLPLLGQVAGANEPGCFPKQIF